MNQNEMKRLERAFKDEISKIFGDNLAFAFVFGSVAKCQEKKGSDIDMFICTAEEASTQQKEDFFNFYMKLHEEYNLTPDVEYPGEVVSWEFLRKNIDHIHNWIPHKKINTYREFEAVFWTAVLAEQKIAVVDRLSALRDLECRCNALVKKWKRMAASEIVSDIDERSLLDVLTSAGCQFLVQHRPEDESNFFL